MRGLLWLVLLLAACNSSTELLCHGTACTCPADAFCSVTPAACGPTGCALECGAHATCSGSCGASCAVSCETGTTCDVSIGAGGTFACGASGDCHATCPLSCTMTCAAGASCTIRCATDDVPRLFTGTASCH